MPATTRELVIPDPVPVDRVMLETRAASFAARSIKTDAKAAGLRMLVSMLDLTTLEGADTRGKVASLCARAVRPDHADDSVSPVGAVCVYPDRVAHAKAIVGSSGVKVASVATAFPSGRTRRDLKMEEVRYALDEGADEIDMVIDRAAMLEGRFTEMASEIAEVRELCDQRSAALKVILEVGELREFERIRHASAIALHCLGERDFIKTSTGKVSPAATPPASLIMLEAIRDHAMRTGVCVGFKPAGGIRTSKQAFQYLAMVKETLGDRWLHPDKLRIGASSLLDDIVLQLVRLRTGVYASRRDVPIS